MTADISGEQIAQLKRNGLSWTEIAEQTGLSVGAARYRYQQYNIDARAEADQPQGAYIIGQTPDDDLIPPDELWRAAIDAQTQVFKRIEQRRNQIIRLKPPCAIALLSDCHFGSPYTDYTTLKRDAEIIRDTPDCYAGFHGDGVDNWIIGKLQGLQRGQVMTFDAEWQLFYDWLKMLQGKLVYVVAGNHDNWTIKVAGFDRVREALRGIQVLYHQDQIVFTLEVGLAQYVVKVRHKWRGSSVFNVTHGIEVSWERGGDDFDIGIGGHTHQGTYHRPFSRHGKIRHAILTGTYKIMDAYGIESGYANPVGRGCGALLFDQAGQLHFYDDLERTANYLDYLRSQ